MKLKANLPESTIFLLHIDVWVMVTCYYFILEKLFNKLSTATNTLYVEMYITSEA